MAIKDFAEDGAFGAAGSSTGSSGTAEQSSMGYGGTPSSYGGAAGTPVGGALAGDWNMNQSTTSSATPSSPLNPDGANFDPGATALAGGGWRLPVDSNFGAGAPAPSDATPMMANSFHFADGGSVDDGGSGGDVGSLLALALSSVDAGLDYGRKKYGLSGGGQQQASMMGRTPAIPGNQSESGIPRPQPMPGPLPPTSNPFGQRRLGQNDQDQDDQGTQTAQAGAIPDNDEDDQEGTA